MRARAGWLIALLLAALAARAGATESGLHILLTNDDGIEATGIVTLERALRAGGHRVTVVAPRENKSGSSASLTFGPIAVVERAPGWYAVDATPASCVLVGLTALADPERPYDLVVSGTNRGANAGPATGISGTVGATTLAVGGFAGVPAIAVSTDPIVQDANDPAYESHFADVAAFAARLVAALQRERGEDEPLLAPGVRLNVNYPARKPEEIAGIHFGVQGQRSAFTLAFTQKEPGVLIPKIARAADAPRDVSGSDSAALANGYITIAPLDTDYTAPAGVREAIQKRLSDLQAFGR